MLGTQEYGKPRPAGLAVRRAMSARLTEHKGRNQQRETTQPPPFVATSSWSGVSDRLLTLASHVCGDQPLAPSHVVTQISRSSAKNE